MKLNFKNIFVKPILIDSRVLLKITLKKKKKELNLGKSIPAMERLAVCLR